MAAQFLIVERQDRIGTIILNRPERRNALSPSLLWEFVDTLRNLQKENQVRCLVIRGAGDKAFSAGYDISEINPNLRRVKVEGTDAQHPFEAGLEALLDFPFPVIAMIHGHAFGAGCELAVACDLRLAAENASFSMPPAKLGFIYPWGGILRFINVVGLANAKEIFFTGRVYGAARAREMNLVQYVFPPGELESLTYQMALEISNNAPLSLTGLKKTFQHCLKWQKIPVEDEREMKAIMNEVAQSEDFQEGRRAFQEKRKPVFKGK